MSSPDEIKPKPPLVEPIEDDVTLHIENEDDTSNNDESSTSTNLVGEGLGRFRTDPLGFMIRLTGESSAFFRGQGWRAYQNYIGSRIFYPEYASKIRNALLSSEAIKQAMQDLAKEKYRQSMEDFDAKKIKRIKPLYKCEREARAQLDSILLGMVADMSSMRTLKFVAFVVNNILVRMYHQGILIKESEFLELRKYAELAEKEKVSLIFLPNHKSHVDYLVISYIFYRMGIALPHIAAGDNLSMPVVGSLLKSCGAFFIRRQWGSDHLYNTVMREYIELLLKKGHNLEAFVEGTRSRIGKLLQPRYGILKIITDAVLHGRVKDVYIVPMSIGYDKVIETSAYVSELLGSPKEKESLFQLFSNVGLLNFKWGRIDVRFSKPFSLKKFIENQNLRRPERWDPMSSSDDFRFLLQSLSYKVLSQINAVTVIMPTALVGTILITLRGNGVGEEEMIRKVNWLKKKILKKGGRVADFGGMTTRTVVERAVQVLRKDLVEHRSDLLESVYFPVNRFELSYYRNQIIHLFVSEAIVSVAMYATVKTGGPQTALRIPLSSLEKDASFLSKLFKNEFVFGSGGVTRNLTQTLKELEEENVVVLGSTLSGQEDQGSRKNSENWVELSLKERKSGRETFDFFCFLLWPFVETYWLSTVSLFTILPKRGTKVLRWVEEKDFLQRAQFFGRTLYYEGDVSYLESVNKETLKNGISRLKDYGLVVVYCGQTPPETPVYGSDGSHTKVPPPQLLGKAATTTWIALGPDWIPPTDFPEPWMLNANRSPEKETSSPRVGAHGQSNSDYYTSSKSEGPFGLPIPSLSNSSSSSSGTTDSAFLKRNHAHKKGLAPQRDDEGGVGMDEESQRGDLAFAQWSTVEPKGRLWEFCEKMGSFRREGKNRRDTATTATRVLRLAALAAVWSEGRSGGGSKKGASSSSGTLKAKL